MKKSLDFLKQLNIKDEAIVVACSGGPDSMALLHILKNNNYNVICAHVHHNLRIESDYEYEFVKGYCLDNNIPFEGMKIESYTNNKFSENEARKKRYDFFFKVMNKYNSKFLATAHHGDDLVETIIMRLIRGSNLSGYKGFSKISNYNNYTIIRPLIFYTKSDIQKYVSDNNLKCVYDKSNDSKKYTRNRIRIDILPILKKENSLVNEKFLDFSEEMNEVNNFVNNIVNLQFIKCYKNNKLNLGLFISLDNYIKKKIIERILYEIYNNNISIINKNHVDNIINLINSDNKYINLPNGLIVKKEYGYLEFCFENKIISNDYEYVLNNYVYVDNYGVIKLIDDTNEKSNYVIKLNSKDLCMPLIVRNKKDSDVILVKNMNGSKKVSRIFIDEKVSKDLRKGYPILCDSNGTILWIPGVKKSKFDCYNKDNYDIIVKYIKKGEYYEEK